MKRYISKCIALFLLLSVVFSHGTTASAAEKKDPIYKYQVKLQQLNDELGLNYELTPSPGCTYEDMVNYYTSMTLGEFEQYIRSAYEVGKSNNIEQAPYENESLLYEYSTYSAELQQFKAYFYSPNYLYIYAYVDTYNGNRLFTGTIDRWGSTSGDTYIPYYFAYGFNSSFSGDMRSVTCIYSCSKYIAKNLTDGVAYTITCTFYA